MTKKNNFHHFPKQDFSFMGTYIIVYGIVTLISASRCNNRITAHNAKTITLALALQNRKLRYYTHIGF